MRNPEGRRPTVIDLFSGAGGFSLGFQAAGCDILAGVDVDETAAQTFADNIGRLQPHAPPLVFSGDEGNIEDLDFGRLVAKGLPDILIGGPPCQGFSRIGRAKLDDLSDGGHAADARNDLYVQFLEAARIWKPLAVVMENVPGMRCIGGRNVADIAAGDLADLGYCVGYAVLNAVWYGVPQFRERLFFIGIRSDREPAMPAATHFAALPSGYSRPITESTSPLPFIPHLELPVDMTGASLRATTVFEAIGDLPKITDHVSGVTQSTDVHPQVHLRCPPPRFTELMRSWPGLPSACVQDHVIRKTPRDYETFRKMKPGDRYPEALVIARARFSDELLRQEREGKILQPGTPGYKALERRFVPPYPEEIFVDKWRKLVPDQPSWTIPAHLSKDAYSHIHYDDDQARAISIREAARLQSFPDGFTFAGNVGERFRQIGNAVPPLLAWAVACKLLELLGFASVAPSWSELEVPVCG